MTKRILVIEDEPQMLLGLRDNLELEGYEVVTAADGEDGLAKAISTAPDLVILIFGGNDYSDLVTLHRMRRTFGKGAFALTPEGQLKRAGFPIPDYPICSEWALDEEYHPVRVDSARERVMCLVQTQLADHSALFTLVSTQLTQNPALLQFLYKLGSPSEGAEASLLSIGGRYPFWSLGVFALCVIVIHGILVYGEPEPTRT